MEANPGQKALRRGRTSQLGSSYFITICTFRRQKILTMRGVPERIFDELRNNVESMELRASVVMPDHIHLVARLEEPNLSKCVGGFKGRSAKQINDLLNRSGPVWQRGFFDHKFRSDEEMGPILHYMWNNPRNPGINFRCNKEDWLWFKSLVTKDLTYPAWLLDNPMG